MHAGCPPQQVAAEHSLVPRLLPKDGEESGNEATCSKQDKI